MSYLEKQIDFCIRDGARRSVRAPRKINERYCSLQNSWEDNLCPYAGDIRVFDVGALGIQRFKEVYECLYYQKISDGGNDGNE